MIIEYKKRNDENIKIIEKKIEIYESLMIYKTLKFK